MNYFFIFIWISLGMLSCSSSAPPQEFPRTDTLYQTYSASYDAAWSATLKALSKYQVTVSNKDSGIIKTDFIMNAHAPKETKWKLELRLIADEAQKIVKVRIEKEAYISPGFLEAWEPLQTDLLVEKAILYRIGRIIELDSKVDKLTTQPLSP